MSVWVTAMRSGVAYHLYDPMDRQTPCGRWHTGERVLVRGHVIDLDVAQEKKMTACARCYGTAEVVAPRTARRIR
jgi:hypothetical protein